MPLTFAELKRQKERRVTKKEEEVVKERRPSLSSQEERFLYSLHLKTIEYRTVMATLKAHMKPSEFNEFIVDYALRLRKAKKNFETNNWKDEWDTDD